MIYYIAIENAIFLVDLPICGSDFLWLCQSLPEGTLAFPTKICANHVPHFDDFDGHSWDDQSLQAGPVVTTCLQGRDARAVDHDGTCTNQCTDACLGLSLAGKVGLMLHTDVDI